MKKKLSTKHLEVSPYSSDLTKSFHRAPSTSAVFKRKVRNQKEKVPRLNKDVSLEKLDKSYYSRSKSPVPTVPRSPYSVKSSLKKSSNRKDMSFTPVTINKKKKKNLASKHLSYQSLENENKSDKIDKENNVKKSSYNNFINPNLKENRDKKSLPPSFNKEYRSEPSVKQLQVHNSLDISNMNANLSLNEFESNNYDTANSNASVPTDELQKQLQTNYNKFRFVMGEIRTDERNQARVEKLYEIFERMYRVVKQQNNNNQSINPINSEYKVKYAEMNVKFNDMRDEYECLQKKYSNLKNVCLSQKEEVQKFIEKYTQMKKENSSMKQIAIENEQLKEEIDSFKRMKKKNNSSKIYGLSSLNEIDIKMAKRNDVPVLNLDKINVPEENENNNSIQSKNSSIELDNKIEKAIDDEIANNPGILEEFENLDAFKQYIISKYFNKNDYTSNNSTINALNSSSSVRDELNEGHYDFHDEVNFKGIDSDREDLSSDDNYKDNNVKFSASFGKSLNDKYKNYDNINNKTLNSTLHIDNSFNNSQLDDDFDFNSTKKQKKKNNMFNLNFNKVDENTCFQDDFEGQIDEFSQSWRDHIQKDKRF